MAFKQPRIPEYRTGEEIQAYIRTLILFLKDFCREAWTASRVQGERTQEIGSALEAIRFPVVSVNGEKGEVTLTASDVNALPADGTAKNAEKLDGKTWAEMMLVLYPVGSIYLAANAVSPASLFGGAWEQIKDRFLLGAGDAYAVGATGGEAQTTLGVNHIPAHTHGAAGRAVYENGGNYVAVCDEAHGDGREILTRACGGGEAHNNMPPYLAVYIWKRVS